jgi:flagellar biosynthesis/type III secretory pathway protein FliH
MRCSPRIHALMGIGILPGERSTPVEIFEYPAITAPPQNLWEDIPEVGVAVTPPSESACCRDEYPSSDTESRESAERATRSFDAGRLQGILEAREMAAGEERALLRGAEEKRVEQAAHLAGQAKDDRERFLREAEHELVRLALVIAARILRREAQMDPLFLTGAVRVALGQLAATVQVRLRIPSAESSLWTETLAHIPNLRVKPSVIPDDSMQLGDCLIETEMGSVDLGLDTQLHQMESALLEIAPADEFANQVPEKQEGMA